LARIWSTKAVEADLVRRFLITVRISQHEEVRRHRAQKKRELHGQLEQIRRRNVQEQVMERRVRKLGLDTKWDTRVFSLRSTDQLLAALAAL